MELKTVFYCLRDYLVVLRPHTRSNINGAKRP